MNGGVVLMVTRSLSKAELRVRIPPRVPRLYP